MSQIDIAPTRFEYEIPTGSVVRDAPTQCPTAEIWSKIASTARGLEPLPVCRSGATTGGLICK